MKKRLILLLISLILLLSGCFSSLKPNHANDNEKETECTSDSKFQSESSTVQNDPPTQQTTAFNKMEQLKALIETKNQATELPVSAPKDGIKILEAYFYGNYDYYNGDVTINYEFMQALGPITKQDGFQFGVTDGLIMFDETEFFPESTGENVYVVFAFSASCVGPYPTECTSISKEGQALSMHFQVVDPENGDAALFYGLVIVKIDKASIGGEINDLSLSFTNTWVPKE